MRTSGRGVRAGVIALALALAGAPALATGGGGPGSSGPEAVVADYRADARIEGSYPVSDLRAALDADPRAKDDPAFAAAVRDAIDATLLGTRNGGATGADLPGRLTDAVAPGEADAPRAGTDAGRALGGSRVAPPVQLSSPALAADAQPPWPLVALSALAGVLAMSGLGAAVYRRLRRPPRVSL